MSYLLIIETSGEICSVALATEEALVHEINITVPNSHTTHLAVIVEDLIKSAQISYSQLSAIAVSAGPGSYTGLRIGVSYAKGLCFALDIPLIALNTLSSIATQGQAERTICAAVEARREDVFYAVFEGKSYKWLEEGFATLNQEFVQTYLDAGEVVFIGPPKMSAFITHPNARFIIPKPLTAMNSLNQCIEKYLTNTFENIIEFEPKYMKAVHVTQPKIKL